jgi:hypothetical protein
VGFELTIPVFEQAKTVHALDRAATVIGTKFLHWKNNRYFKNSQLRLTIPDNKNLNVMWGGEKVKLSLCLSKHHAMKMCGEVEV